MDSKLRKIVDAIEPKRSAKKRSYDVPLRPLKRGADRKPEGHYLKGHRRPEAEEFFFSIDWNKAWQQFLQREQNGRFKYKTARQLARALSIGVDAETKRRRAGYLYRALGPINAADKSKQVPYLGDWDMLRSQTFLGEMKKDSLLFGSPRMKTAREAMRKHVDVMETAKACAETMLNWVARYEMWSRQVDEHYEYKLFDPKLSDKQNRQRLEQYTSLQRQMHEWQAQAVEHVLRCYGVGKDEVSLLLQQLAIVAQKSILGEQATMMLLSGLGGVLPALPAAGGEPANGQSQDPYDQNPTLKLILSSFSSAITQNRPMSIT